MTISDLLQQIRNNLEKRRLEIADGMLRCRMSDFEAYHKNVGIAEGLEQAADVIHDTIKNLNEEDE
jgi:hypothetical protein